MCGLLSDKANQQSKFLIIEKGGNAVVRYVDFRFVPSQRDPSIEVVQYKVNEDGKEKFWTNGSARIMRTMDKIQKGSWICIRRLKWVNKDGSEDITKSSYEIDEIDEKTGKIVNKPERAKVIDNPQEQQNEKVWDEDIK